MLWAVVLLIVFGSLFATIFGSIVAVNYFREREKEQLQRFKREDELAAKQNRDMMLFQAEKLMELGMNNDTLLQLMAPSKSEEKAEQFVRRARTYTGDVV